MQDDAPVPVFVPYDDLEPETLRAVVESFLLREGTDYGAVELALDDKVAGVMRQLRTGVAKILFDPQTQTVTIVLAA